MQHVSCFDICEEKNVINNIPIDNTNSKHLELYSIMAEYDNAGFPMTYCLLSTAAAIEDQKRTKSLAAWALCVKEHYGVEATFVHVDKDMAEIAMAKKIWPKAKISLCWWHLRRAVCTHLANRKLSTTPYNMKHAHAEFPFIDRHLFQLEGWMYQNLREGCSVRGSSCMDRKNDQNRTELDRLGPDQWLQLHAFQNEKTAKNRSQPDWLQSVAIGFRYSSKIRTF